MDRTVYYNTESCSTVSEDSYLSSPYGSARGEGSRELINPNKNAGPISQRQNSKSSRVKQDQQSQQNFRRVDFTSKDIHSQEQQRYYALPKCHASAGPGARHIFHRKIGGSGGGLTRKILHSGISRVAVPCHKDRDEMEFQYCTVLVLHLQCKNIFTLTSGALDSFVNLKNLYLYKNNIRRIQGLDALSNLELLDLSRNNVERIDNLEKCRKLQKLYLGFNEIQVVEGLEALVNLEELHIDDQDMPPEQPILFAPAIMASVAHSLKVLDLSSNQLKTLDPIANLPVLHTLLAADNQFASFESVLNTLESLRQLRFLTLKGNPIAAKPNYKSKVIGVVFRLEVLDGKDINDTTRVCVQKLRLMKEFRARQREEAEAVNRMKQQKQEDQTCLNPNYIDLGNPSDFNFSTPTRLSPLPPPKVGAIRKPALPYGANAFRKLSSTPDESDNEESQSTMVDSTSYETRARSSADDEYLTDVMGSEADQMSDMAKIIFRLSNLDDVGPAGDGSNMAKMKHVNYWEFPGSSMNRECRPLSPLEGENPQPSYSASAPELLGYSEKRNTSGLRPKPAAPGGRQCSNNPSKPRGLIKSSSDFTVLASSSPANTGTHFQTQRHFYGRTLSPLMELPTPESLTARDENNE